MDAQLEASDLRPIERVKLRKLLEAYASQFHREPTANEVARAMGWDGNAQAKLVAAGLVKGPGVGKKAARFIHAYQAEHGVGPTWGELAEHMGWTQGSRRWRIWKGKKLGWLDFDEGVERSLRTGPMFEPSKERGS